MIVKSPNVLIFHVDQMRADALGCYGHPSSAVTPNLDALSAAGCRVTRHIASNPVCMPSRASFFTGLYPSGHGVYTNGIPLNRKEYIPAGSYQYADGDHHVVEPLTMPDHFLAHGYRTASFGKLHLTPSWSPLTCGYPESNFMWRDGKMAGWNGPYYGFEYCVMTKGHDETPRAHYKEWLSATHPDVAAACESNPHTSEVPGVRDCVRSVLPPELHPSEWLADQSIPWLTTCDDNRPFFAFIGFPDPHHPFIPLGEDLEALADEPTTQPVDLNGAQRPDLAELGKDVSHLTCAEAEVIRRYTDAMVRRIDLAIGRILTSLKDAGIRENTLILFTGDHGDMLCDHGRLRKGHIPADQLLRVPCILSVPGHSLPANLDCATSNTAIFATLCELTGLPAPEGLQSGSMFNQEETARAFAQSFAVGGAGSKAKSHAGLSIYDNHHRYSWNPYTNTSWLFDHRVDLSECTNLIHDPRYEEVKTSLHQELLESLPGLITPIVGRCSCW